MKYIPPKSPKLSDIAQKSVWNVTNPHIPEAVARMVIQLSQATNEITSLPIDEAIARLKDELVSGLLGTNNTLPEMVKRVSAIFDLADRSLVECIAQTESSRALHQAEIISARKSGVVKGFRWLCSDDACAVCKDIAARHPNGIILGGVFAKFGDGPYDTIECPPAHPGCMCTMTEILG